MAKRIQVFGESCWTSANAQETISSLAILDEQRSHYFLASHAPMRNMRDRHGQSLDEEQLYQKLFNSGRREVLGVVSGDPGTGKSHLINWLKLRCDRDLSEEKKRNLTTVLIHRRSGTLRDALKQLVEQLGPSMHRYLRDLEDAIVKVSDATSREMLVNALQLELGPRRDERERKALPRELRDLNTLCLSEGFRKWLYRDGGTVAKIVHQLSKDHDVQELGDKIPEFTTQDFSPDSKCRPNNTPAVMTLIEELDDAVSTRESAAAAFNDVLHDAIREMTGLAGTKLRDIFDNIRVELRTQGKRLALFIEDVSVLTALNTEILNAVEPQAGRSDLCDMVAILGMVEGAYKGLPDNQKDRITEVVSLSTANKAWVEDQEEMARFTARYMNAMRLSSAQVRELAEARRASGEISISACSACPVRERCHTAFGSVNFDGIDVGLFPFTRQAPQKLLSSHKDPKRKTPRGLLIDIVGQLTEDTDALTSHEFPRKKLPIEPTPLSFFTAFESKFCAGWDGPKRARMRLLAEKWVDSCSVEETAQMLAPFLEPLGFGSFSTRVSDAPPKKDVKEDKADSDSGTTKQSQADAKYGELQKALAAWRSGGKLKRDPEFRALLADFIRGAVCWDDSDVPPAEIKRHTRSGYEFVHIEDMNSLINKASFFITFERSDETFQLIEALLKFEYEGKGSWRFAHAEVYKRVTHRWIRRHQSHVLASLSPGRLNTELPLNVATDYLALAKVIGSRQLLPDDPCAAVSALLSESGDVIPVVLDDKLAKFANDIPVRSSVAREFIFSELDVPQGTGATKFIDPMPLLRRVAKLRSVHEIPKLDDSYFTGFWLTRYQRLKPLNSYGSLKPSIDDERSALKDLLSSLDTVLEGLGYDSGDLKGTFNVLVNDIKSLVASAKQYSLSHAGLSFEQDGVRQIGDHIAEYVQATQCLREIVRLRGLEVLTCDPSPVQAAVQALNRAEEYLDAVEKELRKQEAHYARAKNFQSHEKKIRDCLDVLIGAKTESAKRSG